MAKVTIQIDDTEDGAINVEIRSEPGFPGGAAEDQTLTNAQMAGLQYMQYVHSEATAAVHECGESCDHDH